METNIDALRVPDTLVRLKGKVVSRNKIMQSAKMSQGMRLSPLPNWEAKEKREEDTLRVGQHASTC
jgi:hypothetical protein